MKLMLLIIPTIQSIVKPIANGPVRTMLPGPNGLLMNVTVMPAATASSGEHELAEQLPAGPELERVVEDARAAVATAPPARSADQLRGLERARARARSPVWSLSAIPPTATSRNAIGDGHAAAARDRGRVDAPVVRVVDVAETDRDAPDERREDEREEGGDDERGDEERAGTSPNVGISRIGPSGP